MTGKIGILLLGYRRAWHLVQVVDALEDQGVSTFEVFLDGAPDREVANAQTQILQYLAGLSWAQPVIHQRQERLGLTRAVKTAINAMFTRYDAVIVLEDDCRPRPGCIDFFRRALHQYADMTRIRSVCAYQYPVAESNEPTPRMPRPAFALRRFNPWGWATWKERWQAYPQDLDALVEKLHQQGLWQQLDPDIQRDSLQLQKQGEAAQIWSLPWILLHFLHEQWVLTPPVTLIDNIGFDGSGAHALDTDFFAHYPPANSFSQMHRAQIALPSIPVLEDQKQKRISELLAHGPIFF